MTSYHVWLYEKILKKYLTPNIIKGYNHYLKKNSCHQCHKKFSKGSICGSCKNPLCFSCLISAINYGKDYNKSTSMCDVCCWWEIS